MKKKKLFTKKKNNSFILIIKLILLIIISILSVLLFNYFRIHNDSYFNIPANTELNYFIPINKGGQKIENQDKKGLHLSYIEKNDLNIEIKDDLKYSIQLYANNSYQEVENFRRKLLNKQDFIFISNHLSVAFFNSSLGVEYLLLYKNFNSRIEGQDYCIKYVHFLDNCIIVNVQNLD